MWNWHLGCKDDNSEGNKLGVGKIFIYLLVSSTVDYNLIGLYYGVGNYSNWLLIVSYFLNLFNVGFSFMISVA